MPDSQSQPYRVLARKYRPQNFGQLIGQPALVRTLTNAIQSGRIAHAFMLTGVRGVGKTTTARIIAKALNYTGPDGKAGPTAGPTGDCAVCRAITEDRHPDVIEMDAASRTGVDDIREILDGVRYAPVEARYKVYIIDEVHMLSKNAFNALLKTLEEPPPHVKFIFATTEIRKVPVTVLSRCQRFDLRRVDVQTLGAHYKEIAALEGVEIEGEALSMIVRAADGSVRDGLSLLDRAISLSGTASVSAEQVRDMLGLADRARSLDLLEKALAGDMPAALEIMDGLYSDGADPLTLLHDLLDLTHMLTRLRVAPEAVATKHAMAESEMRRAAAMAAGLSMPVLGKAWQILLKGLSEVQAAPHPSRAAEMTIIRLAYAADLPDPADLIRRLKDGASAGGPPPAASSLSALPREDAPVAMRCASLGNAAAARAALPGEAVAALAQTSISSLEDVVALLEKGGEYLLAGQVYQFVHLVKLEQGLIEIRPSGDAPPRLAQDLGRHISALTGMRWMITVSGASGLPTLAQAAQEEKRRQTARVLELPVIREIMEIFPGAVLMAIRNCGSEKD